MITVEFHGSDLSPTVLNYISVYTETIVTKWQDKRVGCWVIHNMIFVNSCRFILIGMIISVTVEYNITWLRLLTWSYDNYIRYIWIQVLPFGSC